MRADHRVAFAAVAFLAIGVLVILGALLEWRKERRLRAVGQRTDGMVIRLRWSGRYWYPVFAFRTLDGSTFEVESSVGASPPMYTEGAPVRVLYDPADPEHARIDRRAFGMGRIVALLAFGTFFAAVAAGLWRYAA